MSQSDPDNYYGTPSEYQGPFGNSSTRSSHAQKTRHLPFHRSPSPSNGIHHDHNFLHLHRSNRKPLSNTEYGDVAVQKQKRRPTLKEVDAGFKMVKAAATLYTEYEKTNKKKSKVVARGGIWEEDEETSETPGGGILKVAEKMFGNSEGIHALEDMVEKEFEGRSRQRSVSADPGRYRSSESRSGGGGMATEMLAGVASAAGLGGAYVMDDTIRSTRDSSPAGDDDNSERPQVRRRSSAAKLAEVALAAGAVGLGAYAYKKVEKRKSLQRLGNGGEFGESGGTPLIQPLSQPFLKTLLSELTRKEHVLVQHAAAALLSKEPEIMAVVGSLETMVSLLVKEKAPDGKVPNELFGVSLRTLMKYESTDSHHGAGPTPVRIPIFLDHIITALKAMVHMTIEGIFRVPGNEKLVKKIVRALNKAGKEGSGITVDLAEIDPLTLASIFKKFLRDLPDPLLTGNLFRLFLTASHIKNPAARKRVMHLVICMMPKTNRDVMEVVFLFLDWLSSFAHINLKVGNQMDLSNIARVMAPTLLRPTDRDPHPTELSSMIGALLMLLEDQHALHEIPFELAHLLHIDLPPARDSHSLIKKLGKIL